MTRRPLSNRLSRIYSTAWIAGASALLVHIAGSYGLVHHWSHAEALDATARQSEQVVGVRAAWGVYVNFVFAAVWLLYSAAMSKYGGPIKRIDSVVYVFAAAMMFSATVIFEAGWIRILSAIGFGALVAVHLWPVANQKNA